LRVNSAIVQDLRSWCGLAFASDGVQNVRAALALVFINHVSYFKWIDSPPQYDSELRNHTQ